MISKRAQGVGQRYIPASTASHDSAQIARRRAAHESWDDTLELVQAQPGTELGLSSGGPLPRTLMLVLPVPSYRKERVIFLESQAVNGLRHWARHFDEVNATVLEISEAQAHTRAGISWLAVDAEDGLARVKLTTLPEAYSPLRHWQHRAQVQRILEGLIRRNSYHVFSIGGFFGDWGSLAARLAHAAGIPYAVWADRVEHRIIAFEAANLRNPARAVYRLAYSQLVRQFEYAAVRRASLGLFHGMDTFVEYAGKMRLPGKESVLVHNVHLAAEEHLSLEALRSKQARLLPDSTPPCDGIAPPLRIGYAGRAAETKGPLLWLQVILELRKRGIPVEATWLGDGPLLSEMRAFVARHSLQDVVSLPGFISDRAALLAQLRAWDILLFTHLTPESPRILLEAMASATPLVGFRSHYAMDVVPPQGREFLVPAGQPEALAHGVAQLHKHRARLQQLMACTLAGSKHFTDTATFCHRSDVIKAHFSRASHQA